MVDLDDRPSHSTRSLNRTRILEWRCDYDCTVLQGGLGKHNKTELID